MGYLGIDTSCYTTSVAYLDGEKLAEKRKILTVPQGKRGLRQSEALFQHLGNLPRLLEELHPGKIAAVARSLAAGLNCPFFATSHQEGHLWAGLWSSQFKPPESWLAFHVSGGTTDLLLVQGQLEKLQTLGGSLDLHAGQFVDRVGVRLGLPFPAGPQLELLAKEGRRGGVIFPAPARGCDLSFGGPESQAARAIEQGAKREDVALAVFTAIGRGLVKVLQKAGSQHGIASVLFVGGVTANGKTEAIPC